MAKILWGLAAVFGVMLTALGVLWALQGADLVHIEPIACVGDCEALEDFSAAWLIAGIMTVFIGLAIAWQSVRKLKGKARSSGPRL